MICPRRREGRGKRSAPLLPSDTRFERRRRGPACLLRLLTGEGGVGGREGEREEIRISKHCDV